MIENKRDYTNIVISWKTFMQLQIIATLNKFPDTVLGIPPALSWYSKSWIFFLSNCATTAVPCILFRNSCCPKCYVYSISVFHSIFSDYSAYLGYVKLIKTLIFFRYNYIFSKHLFFFSHNKLMKISFLKQTQLQVRNRSWQCDNFFFFADTSSTLQAQQKPGTL